MRRIKYPICKSKENARHDCVSLNALLHMSLRTGYKIRPSLRLPSSTNFLNNITKTGMFLKQGVSLAFWALSKSARFQAMSLRSLPTSQKRTQNEYEKK